MQEWVQCQNGAYNGLVSRVAQGEIDMDMNDTHDKGLLLEYLASVINNPAEDTVNKLRAVELYGVLIGVLQYE